MLIQNDISPASLTEYKKGRMPRPPRELMRLLAKNSVRMEWIFTGEGNMFDERELSELDRLKEKLNLLEKLNASLERELELLRKQL